MLRLKPWSGLLDARGPADPLGSLLDDTRHPSPLRREQAYQKLRQRLVVTGNWVSAAPKAAEILLADALQDDTPERHRLFDLMRQIRCANRSTPPPPTPVAAELQEVLCHRVEDVSRIDTPDPLLRRSIIAWLDVVDGPLPEGPDPDPAADTAIAIARAKRGLPLHARRPAIAIASLWSQPDFEGLIEALASSPACFPGSMEPARWVAHHLGDRTELGAELFATAIERHPLHPDTETWARQVGQLAFPDGVDTAPTGKALALLSRCLSAPLPRDALGIGGLPPRRRDARAWLGLDPPGPWEQRTDGRPRWQVMEGKTGDIDAWMALQLPASEVLGLAASTLHRPYWLEPVEVSVLEALAAKVDDPLPWALGFLDEWVSASVVDSPDAWLQHGSPPHTNVALMCLVEANHPITAYGRGVSFSDTPERTARLLAAMPQQRDALVLAYLRNPERPDFQEPSVLAGALPHLRGAGNADLVEALLRNVEAVLGMLHHPPPLQKILRDAVRWAESVSAPRIEEWRANLLPEEREGLAAAESA